MKKPRNDQKVAIKETAKELMTNKKAQLIMACGSGKTLTSYWIDAILDNSVTIVFLPSIDLLEQFANVWSEEGVFYKMIVSSKMSKNLEPYSYKKNMKEFVSYSGKKIIFSTYQSVKLVMKTIHENSLTIDMIVCDEAHRVAIGEESKMFKLVHGIKSKYNLFMTATRKILTNDSVYSMSNEDVFGKLCYEYSFSQAISDGILSNYEIFMMGVTKELREFLKNKPYIFNEVYNEQEYIQAISITQVIQNNNANKLIVFSERTKIAKNLYRLCKEEGLDCYYVDGSMSGEDRVRELDNYKKSERGVIFNAKCLIEGIDDATIDGIYFVNDKKSEIAIIQSASRALRGDVNNKDKVAKIFLPMFDSQMDLIDIPNSTVLATLINVFEGDSNGDFFCRATSGNFDKEEERISFKNKLKFEGFDLSMIEDFVMKKIPKKWFSFNQKFLVLKEFLEQRGEIFDSKMIYKSVHLGRFQSEIRRKFKDDRLSFDEIRDLNELGFIFDMEKESQYRKIISESIDAEPSLYYHPLSKIQSFIKSIPPEEKYKIILPKESLLRKASLIIDQDIHSGKMNIYGPLVYSIIDKEIIPLPESLNYVKYKEIQPLLLHLYYEKDVVIGGVGFMEFKHHKTWDFVGKAFQYGYPKKKFEKFKYNDFYYLTNECFFSRISDHEFIIINDSYSEREVYHLDFNEGKFLKK